MHVDLDGKVATFSGGWLSAADAHAAWVALGGSPGAPLDRISWERCRLRSVLSRDGAVGVGSLFEVARSYGS